MTDLTVLVRPLEFDGRNGFWRADDGIGGFYEVAEVNGAFHMCRIIVGHANKLIPYESQEAAFAASNVEQKRRIAAALDPAAIEALISAAEQRGREAGLREAAQACESDVPKWARECGLRGPGNAFADIILALITKEAEK